MVRKKTENPDITEAADALATAEQNTRTPRFPVSPAVLAELAKYGDKTGRTQVQVAEALEPDLLALLRGELARIELVRDVAPAPVHGGEEIASAMRISSLRDRSIAEMAENW